ncbi:MAG: DALR anticodon-binding domain-containing protein, partial [Candidatus Cloacimonadota bacterium]|nr:DALR anticodon-binding domain-containing protein [Candidatus Cloacimonadota bacterium]
AKDLQKFKQNDSFQKLVLGFKRVSNILSKEKNFGTIDENLFEDKAETKLFTSINNTKAIIEPLLTEKKYIEIMNFLVEMREDIDELFDNVMINTKNVSLKKNRYNLLFEIRKMFLQVADISKIVVEL